jgi:hypothetical protein
VIETTQIGGRRSDRLTAGKLSPGNFGLLQQYRHIAAQSRCGGMSAAGESGLRIVIAKCRRGRRAWQCPHSAEADVLALNEGSGF